LSELLSVIFGLLVGGFLGHRLALGRDRRKEFNQVAAPINERLIQAEEQAQNGYVWAKWDDADISRLKPHMTRRQRRKLESLIENYHEAIRLAHTEGNVPYKAPEPIKDEFDRVVNALKELQKLLKLH
tara:strand:+ start:261 stop:644 length:384 start_codon:yes stop_codon:yes gene_type:complete